jgi:starch-binding outer membrane protein, SusD/RagB family
MKIIKYIILASIGVFLLPGCSDFLNSDPTLTLVESNYYKTEKDAQNALIGCYDGLQNIYTGDDFPSLVAPSIMSDECFGGGGTGDGKGDDLIDEFDKQLSPSDLNMYKTQYINSYLAIYRCNMLISKINQISWSSDANPNKVEAQARFIRAYTYFELVKLLGNIPLVEKPVTPAQAEVLAQSSSDDVYKLIESDLLFATANAQLKDTKWTESWAKANDGYATVYAAKSLLARVYLFYTGYYNKTTLPGGTTKETITTNLLDVYSTTSGHGLVADYKTMWPGACSTRNTADTITGLASNYVGEGNKETVWAIKFNSSGTWGSNDGFFGMRLMGMRSGTVKSFGTSVYGDGAWGCATVNPKFVSEWKAEEPTDLRLKSSVIDFVNEGLTLSDKFDQREYTGYCNKKYTCLGNGMKNIYTAQGLDFQINEYQDFVVIRYADVLLMLSELTGDAKYMNEVRARVGLTAVAYSSAALRAERKHEFAFEGIRYWDLLRYDHTLQYAANAIKLTSTDNVKVTNGYGDKTGTVKLIDGQKLIDSKGLGQFPNDIITLSNGILKQNDGWK